jgi:hypothetical protein
MSTLGDRAAGRVRRSLGLLLQEALKVIVAVVLLSIP